MCWPKRGVRHRRVASPGAAEVKKEAELSVGPRVLEEVPLRGRVVTGDALYCHRALCQQICQQGGDYFFTVKENQPRLLEDIALLFTWPPPGEVFAEVEHRNQHGDRAEVRRLQVASVQDAYFTWPVAGGSTGLPDGTNRDAPGQSLPRGGLRDPQPRPADWSRSLTMAVAWPLAD